MSSIHTITKRYLSNYTGLPATCWQGILLSFLNATSIGVCFFISLYFINTLHISMATTGLLISFYGIGMTLGGILGGKLSDVFPPRLVATVSVLLQSSTYFMLAVLQHPILLMMNLFTSGLAAYAFKTANNTWLFERCGSASDLRLKTVSVLYAFGNLGLGISGIIVGLFAHYGFEYIFYFSGFLLLSSGVYLIATKDIPATSTHTAHSTTDTATIHQENKPLVWMILGCLFLIGLIIAQLSTTYPLYIQSKYPELGLKAVSILFLLDSALIVTCQAPISQLIKSYNKILIVGVGALCMGLGMMLLNGAFTFLLAIISCVIWTTGEMLFLSTAQVVCFEKGNIKKKGQNLGLFQSVYAASTITGPAIGGYLYGQLGGDALWYISGVVGMICFIACYLKRQQA